VTTTGVLLAAGAGRRMGRPKALVEDWLVRSVGVLWEGGCAQVLVVLGAAADEARTLLEGQDVEVVVARDWDEGMGASLRAGLAALSGAEDAALVTLVDVPDVGPDVVRRLLDRPVTASTLARASYEGRPGHPVLLGREHWGDVVASAQGDRGARAYLDANEVLLVECGDLATGRDVDQP
jgi:CTP:molybdopterin cytidylyltransferase MocA